MVSEVISLVSVILPEGVIHSTVPGHTYSYCLEHTVLAFPRNLQPNGPDMDQGHQSTPEVSSADMLLLT